MLDSASSSTLASVKSYPLRARSHIRMPGHPMPSFVHVGGMSRAAVSRVVTVGA
jgi:hypothetical protein